MAHSRANVRVIEVEHLVVEGLQRAFGEGDQPDRKVQAGQPRGRFDQMGQVLEVDLDVAALADAPHGGDETDSGIGLDHIVKTFCYTVIVGRVCSASATLASG